MTRRIGGRSAGCAIGPDRGAMAFTGDGARGRKAGFGPEKSRRRAAAAFGVVAAGLLAFAWGCGSARRGAPLVLADGDGDPRVTGGEYAFMRHCQPCHPGGDAGVGPALNNKTLLPNFLIRFQVRNGLGRMPAFPEDALSAEELDAIVAYLNHLQGLERK